MNKLTKFYYKNKIIIDNVCFKFAIFCVISLMSMCLLSSIYFVGNLESNSFDWNDFFLIITSPLFYFANFIIFINYTWIKGVGYERKKAI